jgi:hypothetical protein
MNRILKTLIAAAMALTAIGAIGAAGAQAAPEFHCHNSAGVGLASCKIKAEKDGTVKVAHHVFIVKNVTGESTSITCGQITGSGTITSGAVKGTTTTAKLEAIAYDECNCFGSEKCEIKMNGCKYEFNSNGTVSIVGCEKDIEINVAGVCTIKVPAQNNLATVTYKTIGTSPTRTITVEPLVKNIEVTTKPEGTGCGIKTGPEDGPYTGEYTTGNTIVQAQEDTAEAKHADGWWL